MPEFYEQAWQDIMNKVTTTSDRIKAGFPHVAYDGKYDDQTPGWWTAGFWPGLLWLVYRHNGDDQLLEYARECEDKLDAELDGFVNLHHDVGFMWGLSAVADYNLTGNEKSKIRGLKAASTLAGRFNIKGNFIRAWSDEVFANSQGWVIIDCMMNLPLLYWASQVRQDPMYKHIAKAHTETVINEFIREDGSVYHIVCFDPETGERVDALGGQGYSKESAWSRGAAWAIYGLAMGYGYTKEEMYLEKCKQVADFFIAHLPEDGVPVWDFRAPKDTLYAKDSSAGACAASGLIELSYYLDGQEKEKYLDVAKKILKSLYVNYGNWDTQDEGLINEGTVAFPAGRDINVPIIYGDYYFAEAISKLVGYDKRIF